MAGVAQLLAIDGEAASLATPDTGPQLLSPRQKGVRRGAMLVFLGCLLTPLAGLLHAELEFPFLFIPLFAILGILGGILRMLYAAIFEERYSAAVKPAAAPVPYVPPAHSSGAAALPPHTPPAFSVADVRRAAARPRQNTAELGAPPPSVTDNTTQLLKNSPESGAH